MHLYPFQERLLEQIALARQNGHHHNLLVAATGTGKTVMAAVDYARLHKKMPRSRLLFVAHRERLLAQSRLTLAHVLRDASFGEMWVDGQRPSKFEHVFASIQSLSAGDIGNIDPEHFDVVIIDEFHHAAARTYRELLDHLRPKELLGLTATPERADNGNILGYFDGRIAAELRIWDAIDQQYLVPFTYYGVHDGTDLSGITWRRGRGYDTSELTNLYTADDIWVGRILEQVRRRILRPTDMRALGFCVDITHAQFMASRFTRAGLNAVALWADTPTAERTEAINQLERGELQAIFTVDLFNEGVDIPAVDTLLLLRPTDSALLFLQQLGRGLRKSPDKASCTVLDFVALHRKEFRFDRKFRALLGGTRPELVTQIEKDFPFLPAGCSMQMDQIAAKAILDNIRESLPSTWNDRRQELEATGRCRSRRVPGPDRPRPERHLRQQPLVHRTPPGRRTASGCSRPKRDPAAASRRPPPARRRPTSARVSWQEWLRAPAPPQLTPGSKDHRLFRMLVGITQPTGANGPYR